MEKQIYQKILSRSFAQFFTWIFLASLSFTICAEEFNHPGALHSKSDLDFIKSKVNSETQPWKTAFNELKSSQFGKLTYNYSAYKDVKCGSYNNPNVGCNNMVEDGIAAYTMALRWYIEGDDRYADQAIEIIDAWSVKYRSNEESNSRLVVSWATPWYVNAAEILRYTDGSGWTNTNTNRLNTMLNRFKEYIFWEGRPNNNWMMSSVEARLAIAVFQNDRTAFDDAVNKWRYRIKTYLYQSSDGRVPLNSTDTTSAKTAQIWSHNGPQTAYVNGQGMETCRDFNHMKLGFDSLMGGAETAWQQGVDLFSEESRRIKDFLELHGHWATGSRSIPENVCEGTIDWKGTKENAQAAFEIAYNHLHDRLGISMPETKQMIDNNRPHNAARWVSKWETLSYAGRDFNSTTYPPNVSFNDPTGNITLDEDYSDLYIEVAADDPDGNISNVKLYINNSLVRQETTPPYEWGHASSPNSNETTGLSAGTYTFKALATDDSGLSSEDTFTLNVIGAGAAPNVYFSTPSGNKTLPEGYSSFYLLAAADDSDGTIANLKLYIDGTFIRQETNPPYEWGHATSPNENETGGLSVGTHTFKVVATDDSGMTNNDTFTLTVENASSGDTNCQLYSGSNRIEFNLSTSSCVEFEGGLNGKTLQLWDSDIHTGCNFRGTAESTDSSITISSNYQSVDNVAGNSLEFSSSNNCNYIKLRAY